MTRVGVSAFPKYQARLTCDASWSCKCWSSNAGPYCDATLAWHRWVPKGRSVLMHVLICGDRARLLRLEGSASIVRSHGLPGLLGAGDLPMMWCKIWVGQLWTPRFGFRSLRFILLRSLCSHRHACIMAPSCYMVATKPASSCRCQHVAAGYPSNRRDWKWRLPVRFQVMTGSSRKRRVRLWRMLVGDIAPPGLAGLQLRVTLLYSDHMRSTSLNCNYNW